MGQRHQLFVIAKVGSHYRSLAVAHHQWLYGLSALRTCFGLLEIFSHPDNRIPLGQELQYAKEYFKDSPAPSAPPKYQRAESAPSKFPFITTCLIAGASYNSSNGAVSVVHEEPFGLGFDQGDNNDGITVIDMTDFDEIKYCFVNFSGTLVNAIFVHSLSSVLTKPGDFTEQTNDNLLHRPLTGSEYLSGYYDKESLKSLRFGEAELAIVPHLDAKPLVDIWALADAWPWGVWKLPKDSEKPQDHDPPHHRGAKGLVEQSIEKLVGAVLAPHTEDEFATVESQLDALPNMQPRLKNALLAKADEVGKTASSAALLTLAYKGEQNLDWSSYVNLDPAVAETLFKEPALQNAKSVNLSGTALSKSPKELWSSLALLDNLESVFLLEPPTRLDDDESITTFKELATYAPHMRLKKLVMSGIMSRTLRFSKAMVYDDTNESVPPTSSFPVVQLLVSRDTDPDTFGHLPPFEYFFLGDALLSPTRFVTGLTRYLGTLTSMDYSASRCSGLELSFALATSLTSPSRVAYGEVNTIPTAIYRFAKKGFLSSGAAGCFSEMRNLVPGQWTVMVSHNTATSRSRRGGADTDDDDSNANAASGPAFQYAFVRPNVEIAAEASKEGEPAVTASDIEVLGINDFLRETSPDFDVQVLKPWLMSLSHQVSGEMLDPRTYSSDGTLALLDQQAVCEMLTKFMDSIPAAQKRKEMAKRWG